MKKSVIISITIILLTAGIGFAQMGEHHMMMEEGQHHPEHHPCPMEQGMGYGMMMGPGMMGCGMPPCMMQGPGMGCGMGPGMMKGRHRECGTAAGRMRSIDLMEMGSIWMMDLSDKQREKIADIWSDHRRKMIKARAKAADDMRSVLTQEQREQEKSTLTPRMIAVRPIHSAMMSCIEGCSGQADVLCDGGADLQCWRRWFLRCMDVCL